MKANTALLNILELKWWKEKKHFVQLQNKVLFSLYLDKPKLRSKVGSWDYNNLTLDCEITAVPAATVQWFGPEGREITRSTINSTDGSRLTVTTSSPGDYGHYICRASNKIGNTDQTFAVTRLGE